MSRPTARRCLRSDAGLTLPELMMTITVLLVVSAVVSAMSVSVFRATTRATDEAKSGNEVQTVVERMSRDLRMARAVDTAQPATLTFWLDADGDYVRDANETVTWKYANTGPGGAMQLTRSTSAGTTQVIGGSAVTGLAFGYTPSPGAPVTVGISLTYVTIGGNNKRISRTAVSTVRMRNRG